MAEPAESEMLVDIDRGLGQANGRPPGYGWRMSQVLGYRAGWTVRRELPVREPWQAGPRWVGEGDVHAVPDGTDLAMCGRACVYFDGQPFSEKLAMQCRGCVVALRALAIG